MSLHVKICGVRSFKDAEACLQSGADAIGLNFFASSPRYVADRAEAARLARLAASHGVVAVGLFVNPTADEVSRHVEEIGLTAVQLHGEEPPALGDSLRRKLDIEIWKAYRVATSEDLRAVARAAWPCDKILLDSRVRGAWGGTGRTFDWSLLRQHTREKPLVLAGGLGPSNVAAAIRAVRPDWVDTASGVEATPGAKDPVKIKAFIDAARRAAAELDQK